MNGIGVTGMTVTQVLGYGIQKGHDAYYRGVKLDSVNNILHKRKTLAQKTGFTIIETRFL